MGIAVIVSVHKVRKDPSGSFFLREEMDGLARVELKETLYTMNELSDRYGFDSALEAMEEAAKSGRFTSATSMVLAARLATFEPEGIPNVDLSIYDAMLESAGGVCQ